MLEKAYLEHATLGDDFLSVRLYSSQCKQLGLENEAGFVQVQLEVIKLLAAPLHVD